MRPRRTNAPTAGTAHRLAVLSEVEEVPVFVPERMLRADIWKELDDLCHLAIVAQRTPSGR